jgi:hypothetical protein
MALPDWLNAVIIEEMETATGRILGASTPETLWAAKGRLEAVTDIKLNLELAQQALEREEKERLEGILSHGN